jgi:ribose transport system substrate-binding protein
VFRAIPMRKKHRSWAFLAAIPIAATVVTGCSSSSSSSSQATAAPSQSISAAGSLATSAAASPDTSAAASPATSGSPAASGAGFLASAEAAVAKATLPETQWYGPTTGPKGVASKSIACIAGQLTIDSDAEWCKGISAAAKTIGWTVTTLDGAGTLSGQSAAILQALSTNVNGLILTGVDPSTQQSALGQANQRGVKIICIQGLSAPGPAPQYHIYDVVTQRGPDIGKLAADVAIVDGGGHAQGVLVDDPDYQIARVKTDDSAAEFKACTACKLLTTINSPGTEITSLFPSQLTATAQKYSGDVYYIAISDSFFDYGTPALKAAGVPGSGKAEFIGEDGSPSAYARIRQGEYEIATISPPEDEQGWQAVDEMNRAFAGESPSGYVPPLQVLTAKNINTELTPQGFYNPPVNYEAEYAKIWKG